MTIMRTVQILAFSLALVLAPNCVAQLTNYTQIDFPGATLTNAFAINDSGDIVGSYKDASGILHGYRLSKGIFTTINYPGALTTAAMAINSRGEVAGTYTLDGSTQHSFVLTGGVFTPIDVPTATMSGAFGINPRGEAVGHTRLPGSTKMFGWVVSKGQYSTFDFTSPNDMTCAFGINAEGTIVGHYKDTATKKIYGWIYRRGEYTTFEFPGSVGTMIDTGTVNAAGDIVGPYTAGDGSTRGFLRTKGGEFFSITIPGAKNSSTRGINDRGQIVGVFVDAGNAQHGYFASLE